MSSFKRIAILVLVLFYLLDLVAGVHPDETLVSMACNTQGFGWSVYQSDYDDYLEEVFHDLISQTPLSGYDRYNTVPVQDDQSRILDTFYGHGACNGVLVLYDCTNCLITAAGLIRQGCPSSYGATCQLVDCRVRFETYPYTDQ